MIVEYCGVCGRMPNFYHHLSAIEACFLQNKSMSFGKKAINFGDLIQLLVKKVLRIPLNSNTPLNIIKELSVFLNFGENISKNLNILNLKFTREAF